MTPKRKQRATENAELANLSQIGQKRSKMSYKAVEKSRWSAFRDFILERDGRQCWTCGTTEGIMQAGHLISRRKTSIKYDTRAVHTQCSKCNWRDKFQPGYHDYCVTVFIKKMGLAVYNELVNMSGSKKESKEDIVTDIEKFQQWTKELKENRLTMITPPYNYVPKHPSMEHGLDANGSEI